MIKNPFISAALAAGYIAVVSSLMFYGMEHTAKNDTVIVPIAVLSLFSLSAAVMGYLFILEPAQLYLDGKKKEALNLFLQTVGVFALITTSIFAILFSGIIR